MRTPRSCRMPSRPRPRWPELNAGAPPSQRRTIMPVVGADTHQTLSGISSGSTDGLEAALGLREADLKFSGLDARTFALVKIAALIALDAPPASYAWQIANAMEEGVTPEDIVGVLRAVAPQVGGPRTVAAAAEIMVSMGLPFDEGA